MNAKKIASALTTVILLGICIVLTAAIVMKLTSEEKDEGLLLHPEAQTESASNVYVSEVQPSLFVKTLKFYGSVEDESNTINIINGTSGYVSQVLVREDDTVVKGQIIGYIDPSTVGSSYQKYAVTAKVDGRIEDVSAAVGSYVTSGSVFAVEKETAEYVVKVNIPERYLDSIHIGTKAYLSSSVRSALKGDAYISYISGTIDSSSRTVEVKLDADDTSLFLDGLALTLNLVIDEESDVFTVPSDAINTLGGIDYVFVAEDGIAVKREVGKGNSNDSETVILSGLKEGDLVIVEGTVTEGSPVNIVER